MEEQGFLTSAVIFLAAVVVVVPIFKRIGFGTVLGYLAAGVAIGPSALGLVSNADSVLHFAELGVVLLLFLIGLELDPKKLWQLRRPVFGVGGLQLLVSAGVLTLVFWLLGLEIRIAMLAGLALGLSSTAMGLQLLGERNQLSTRFGRSAFAILLFQDLAAIPIIALVPLLAVGSGQEDAATWLDALEAVGVLVAVAVGGHYLLRPVFRIVAATRSREVFAASALLLVIGTGLLMVQVGLSMALGAFLAGVLLADSEYRLELEANIDPFKGLLMGLFFLAIGMTMDFAYIAEHWSQVLLWVAALMLLKAAVLVVLGLTSGLGGGCARQLALTLSQGGEFAFVIITLAVGEGVFDSELSALLTAVVTLSMALTPILFAVDDQLAPRWLKRRSPIEDEDIVDQNPRVVIAGFGRFGQIVARVLAVKNIHFTALDLDPDQVQFVRNFGNEVFFGDPGKPEVLRSAGAEHANVLVLAIDDVERSVNAVKVIREKFPHLKIFARARNRFHAYQLVELGVDYLIRETYVSSLEMADAVLQALGLPSREASRTVRLFRQHDEDLLMRAAAHHEDMEKLIELAKEGRKELAALFTQDQPS